MTSLMDYLALTCAQPRKCWATMTVTARMSPWCPEGLASSLSLTAASGTFDPVCFLPTVHGSSLSLVSSTSSIYSTVSLSHCQWLCLHTHVLLSSLSGVMIGIPAVESSPIIKGSTLRRKRFEIHMTAVITSPLELGRGLSG